MFALEKSILASQQAQWGELEGAEPASNKIECPAKRRAQRGFSRPGGKIRHFQGKCCLPWKGKKSSFHKARDKWGKAGG